MIPIIIFIVVLLAVIIVMAARNELDSYGIRQIILTFTVFLLFIVGTNILCGTNYNYVSANTDNALVYTGKIKTIETDALSGADLINIQTKNRYFNTDKIDSGVIYVINDENTRYLTPQKIANIQKDGEPTYEVYRKIPKDSYWLWTIFPLYTLPDFTTMVAYTPTGQVYINYR